MQRFARWTNLSETTFVLPADRPGADYRVRIFTPGDELPFAGHPTLGTCHAWLGARADAGDARRRVVQECGAGLVAVRRDRRRPRLRRAAAASAPAPVDEALVQRIAALLRIERAAIVDAQWVGQRTGLGRRAARQRRRGAGARDRRAVDLDIGVVGPYPAGAPEAFEVRAFFPDDGATGEDPVTGSLNASLAQWLLGERAARRRRYVASQGTALGRAGRVHISRDGDGTIWVGGGTVTCVSGDVEL